MSPHKPIFANIRDNYNLGDMLCSAHALFPELKAEPPVDFREVADGPEPLIIGGGGMLHNGVDDWISRQARRRPVFLFGVGVNYHDVKSMRGWDEKIKPCLAVGLRDRGIAHLHPRFSYCPCPTAGLAPWDALRARATHEHDMLIFQHYDRPIGAPFAPKVPRLSNVWNPGFTLEEIARYLGLFDKILTNSYHGALWGIRMGCRVVVWKPFSTRFSTGFPLPVPFATTMEEALAKFAWWENPQNRKNVDLALQADYSHLDYFKEVVLNIAQ